jgi:hypothetical protein
MHAQGSQLKRPLRVLRILFGWLDAVGRVALPLVLGIAGAQVAHPQGCYWYEGNPPPPAPPYSWTVLDQGLGGTNGRVAVVVDRSLYYMTHEPPTPDPAIVAALATYVADLSADGYSYRLAAFSGSVTELRNKIKALYYEPGVSLDGAVLVGGGLPWATLPADTPPCGPPPYSYPFEGYLMDLDDDEAEWGENPPASGQLQFWPGDRQAQVWVSRIKADNLPEIWVDARPATEAEIIETYFARNHLQRWDAFNPQQRALAYYSSQELLQLILEDPATAMRAAFDSVETVMPGYASYEDYVARLGRAPGDPPPYGYIHALGWGGQTEHDPGVSGNDYIGAQSEALGIFVDSCNGGDFSWVPFGSPGSPTNRGYVAGDACFGLAARTLVVSAYATQPWHFVQVQPYALWTRIGAARSYGDGYRAQFNQYGFSGMVLIGDGSIKGTSYDWTGGGDGVSWLDFDNWEAGQVPGSLDNTDRVRIDAATVEVTDAPDEVWSIDLRNGAGLQLNVGATLHSHTSLIGESSAANTLQMQPQTNLYLGQDSEGQRGSLLKVRVEMDDTPDGITHLSAERAMDDCTVARIGSNCQLDVAEIRRSSINLVSGTLNVDNLWFSPWVSLGAGRGTINAGSMSASTIAVPSGTLSAESIVGCLVTIEGQGELIADLVTASIVMTGGTATINQEAYLQLDATNAIITIGGYTEGPDWNLSDTQLTAGPAVVSGNWTMSASTQASFASLSTYPNAPASLGLSDGTQLVIQELPEPTFWDDLENELTYAGLGSELEAGHEGMPSQALHVGDETRIRGAEGGELALDLSCGLDIASEFTPGGFVASGWDSSQTDVTLRGTTQQDQVLELVSTPPRSCGGQAPNVVFSDVPCDGKLRDLKIVADEGENSFATVAVVNARDNQPGGGPEAGIYSTVTIGANRPMSFTTAAGVLWYYSNQLPTVPESGSFSLDGAQKSWPTYWPLVIKHATCTFFGDWNGDGQVSTPELKALQDAIQYGPYNGLYDGDCSGTLDNDDLNKFLANYGNPLNGSFLMPAPAGDDPSLGAGDSASAEYVEGDDDDDESVAACEAEPMGTPELATWLAEQLPAEDLAAFVAQASATAAETTDERVQADLTELLPYLQP